MSTPNNSVEQKDKVVRMINRSVNTNMFESEIKETIDNADKKYRWYLCTETKPAGWTCERKNAYEILGATGHMDKTTTTVPVYKFIPSAFDNLIVRHNIRSMTSVTIIR